MNRHTYRMRSDYQSRRISPVVTVYVYVCFAMMCVAWVLAWLTG